MKEYYALRTCYVNFAEHLQNAWNINFMYENASGGWSDDDFRAFFRELVAFGYNNFQFWIPPTLAKPAEAREKSVARLRRLIALCHEAGLKANALLAANTIGAEWYFACPNDPHDHRRILEFWDFFVSRLTDLDIFTIFPGDPGGCNRNGCDHNTFLALAAEIAARIKQYAPNMTVEIGSWGTPYTGWGEDMRVAEGWDGTFAMLLDPTKVDPEIPCHIWNGTPERVERCMRDTVARLPDFPADSLFSINAGFNPDCEPEGAFDARPYAKKIAETLRLTSWDYSASEGELICYPHFRLHRFARKRRIEVESAPYYGAICYTMSPKLNLLTLYGAAQLMKDPYRDVREIASSFTHLVFGDPAIGPLMEAFEIVPGWGFEGLKGRTRPMLRRDLEELIRRLEAAKGHESRIPIFPTTEEYREDLLYHARTFLTMLSDHADREAIRQEFWARALSIYDEIPMSVDERAELAAKSYSEIGSDIPD